MQRKSKSSLKQKAKSEVVHGDDLLYRFFLDVLEREEYRSTKIPQMMIEAMAIWLPLDVYRQWPVLLPWVVRDPTCRGNKSKRIPDQWGAPNNQGFLRDDNSLIKSLPRSLTVIGPKGSKLQGAKMGTEFVASHVWREVNHVELASRLPLLNSFVPNLAWLPSQVSKLTDREAKIVQSTFQAMSYSIYRKAPVHPSLVQIVNEAWSLIPIPTVSIQPVNLDKLNWFDVKANFFETRRARLISVTSALERLKCGETISEKIITTRYSEGLPKVSPTSRESLLEFLRHFIIV